MKKNEKKWIYPFIIMGFVLMFSNSCNDITLDMNGTKWRWEGEQYNVYQAWTLVFTSATNCESWWGTSDNYYQNKGTVGTYTINGNTITFISSTTYSGTGSYTNKKTEGVINGNKITIDGIDYIKLK